MFTRASGIESFPEHTTRGPPHKPAAEFSDAQRERET
jgi:hypothetical protein